MCFSKSFTENKSSSHFQCKQFSTLDISLLQPNCSAFANFQLIRKRDKADSLGFSYYAKQKPKQTSFIVENIYSYIADARSQTLTSASTWDLCHLVYTGYFWLDRPPSVSKHGERNIIFQIYRGIVLEMHWFDSQDSKRQKRGNHKGRKCWESHPYHVQVFRSIVERLIPQCSCPLHTYSALNICTFEQ